MKKSTAQICRRAALAALLLLAARSAADAQVIFLQSPCTSTIVCAASPYMGGVETLPDGKVVVARSFVQFINTVTVISVYTPQGAEVGRLTFNFNVGSVYFVRDPGSGWLVGVLDNGQLFAFNPENTAENGFLFGGQSIGQMAPSNANVYDAATNQTNLPVGTILHSFAKYGDITMRQAGGEMDLFVGAVDQTSVRPFVVRLRVDATSVPSLISNPGVTRSMSILASSRVPAPRNFPPGVAVNSDNVVLTTLPICINGTTSCFGTVDVGVSFGGGLPEGGGPAPQRLYNNAAISSLGIGTDSDGNFYVATGSTGSSLCPQVPGGLMRIPRDRTSAGTCYPPVSTVLTGPANTLDAAPNAERTFVYVPTNYATSSPFYVFRFDSTPTGGGGGAARLTTIGLYNPFAAAFFLRNTNSQGDADVTFFYGPANLGWEPLVGDWNGDGTDTAGLYNPSQGAFYLRNANSQGNADITFFYGPANAGWVPLAGDWNGDGVDTAGLYNPSQGAFYLRNANSQGNADTTFFYGPAGAGWEPLVGDWNGDGVDTVGLYNPSQSAFYLRNTNSQGNADVTFFYGPANAGWVPLAGDWNGDRIDTVGFYSPSQGAFYLRDTNSQGNADVTFFYGPITFGWIPLAGDWNGQ